MSVTDDLQASVAEALEGQLRWCAMRYEVQGLEAFTFQQLDAAMPRNGMGRMIFGDPSSPTLEYTPKGICVFHGDWSGPTRTVLLAATRTQAIELVLRHRRADPAAAIERDLQVAERTRDMYERAVENARGRFEDPGHPAYPHAQADPDGYAAKRAEANETLSRHLAAIDAHRKAPLSPAPAAEQPSLF